MTYDVIANFKTTYVGLREGSRTGLLLTGSDVIANFKTTYVGSREGSRTGLLLTGSDVTGYT